MSDWQQIWSTLVSDGLLNEGDLSAIKILSRQTGVTDPLLKTLCALSLAAIDRGDVCLDLNLSAGLRESSPESLAFLSQIQKEARKISWETSPLISVLRPGEKNFEKRPFVLDLTFERPRLYSERAYVKEQLLSQWFRTLASSQTRLPVFDVPLLQRGLYELFHENPNDLLETPGERAARQSFECPLTVLVGGPGTGKTWTVRNLLALHFLQREQARLREPSIRPLSVALAAPTGKAAARMAEAIVANLESFEARVKKAISQSSLDPHSVIDFLTNLEARTIHRLLGVVQPGIFYHDSKHPLPADLVIIDEVSMVDLFLMASLAQAIGPKTHVVLIGDPGQLASVEAGTVLGDLALQPPESLIGRTLVELKVSRRFDPKEGIGRFARACEDLARGRATAVQAVEALTQTQDQTVRFLRHGAAGASNQNGLSNAVLAEIDEWFQSYTAPMMAYLNDKSSRESFVKAFELFNRFRVLSAHRRGVFGVEGLNLQIKSYLRKQHRRAVEIGTPILILRNDPATGLMNGDIGLALTQNVAFPDAVTGVRFVAFHQLPEHEMAFAMTVHKAQGSEFDHAFVVLPAAHSAIVTRELCYTAATRAKKRLTVLADPQLLKEALATSVTRASGLSDRLLCREM